MTVGSRGRRDAAAPRSNEMVCPAAPHDGALVLSLEPSIDLQRGIGDRHTEVFVRAIRRCAIPELPQIGNPVRP